MSAPLEHHEQYIILYALLGLGLGIAIGATFPLVVPVSHLLEFVVQTYDRVAPFVLYFVLAPSLLKMIQQKGFGGARFSLYTTFWFAKVRLFACVFAVIAVSLVYGLPLLASEDQHEAAAALTAFRTFGRMATESRYFYAIYTAIITVIVLRRRDGKLVRRFIEMPELLERFGKLLTHVVPLFTLMMGVYVATLPDVIADALRKNPGAAFGAVSILGIKLTSASRGGILSTYLCLALLTGIICTLWHVALLLYVRYTQPGFRIGAYFRGYFVKLYPLLWATCSEALGTPLNLHLVKKNYPNVDASVRQLTISAGSVFNVNGTLTCCFVMIPAVCMMLHIDVSMLGLFFCLPVIYIIGFGIPGIPGELVLFAGPLMGMLGIPPPQRSAFLLLFIGMQAGLPDSFRSGANSTDGCPSALLLDEIYKRDYMTEEAPVIPAAEP